MLSKDINVSSSVAWGSYFDHALAWEKRLDDPNVMIVTYEELKQVEQSACCVCNITVSCSLTAALKSQCETALNPFDFHNVMCF